MSNINKMRLLSKRQRLKDALKVNSHAVYHVWTDESIDNVENEELLDKAIHLFETGDMPPDAIR